MTPERTERLLSVMSKRQPDLAVVLENVFDPHNISAVMRTCDAVGIQDVFVLNTKIPRHKKVIIYTLFLLVDVHQQMQQSGLLKLIAVVQFLQEIIRLYLLV